MKKIALLLALVLSLPTFAQRELPNDAPEFIVKAALSRIMDREQGKLAAAYGSTQAIRDYGTLMVKEQDFLLGELKDVAAAKGITIPNVVSEKDAKSLAKLGELRGEKFDRRFLKMIKADHRRDIRKFTAATKFDDVATRQYATTYLPLVTGHLEKAKAL